MKNLVVNATALDRSGALTILRQFVENIPVDANQWIIFISDSVDIVCDKPNVRLESVSGVKPMHRRLLWDAFGLKRWLKRNDICPDAAISLQNTGFIVGKNVPSFIYYHQPIPFYPFDWQIFNRRERTFWFYKHIYPFFVKLFLRKDTKIFVQLDFIKNGFAKCYKHPLENISVLSPSVIEPKAYSDTEQATDTIKVFYPASGYFYKNHRVIAEALKYVDSSNLEVIFTTKPLEDCRQDNRINYIGVVPYDKVCAMYRSCDCLVFPSYIETFGLPLLEAAMTGMPIIAADLPYAREVLSGYKGAEFVPFDKPQLWADAIKRVKKGFRNAPIDISKRQGWKDLFDIITSNI